jgi:acyl-phosphate glycerol 3-phosphate acyltransferase
MTYLIALAALSLAYLSGSVNYAIIVTRLVIGKDIRTLGNRNPGTANVGRSVGKGWAAAVFLLDVAKGLGPMILTRLVFFPEDVYWHFFIVAAVGMAAVIGHCRPVFFQFRGGGGIATSIGVYSFFIPAELLVCLVLAFLIAIVFLKGVRFRVGQGVPILFVSITPFVTLLLNYFIEVPLFAGRSLGAHPWYILVIAFALSVFITGMNFSFVRGLFEPSGGPAEDSADRT